MINKLAENPSAYGIVFGALSMAICQLFDTSLTRVISPHFEGIILGFAVAAVLHFIGSERAAQINLKKDLAALHHEKVINNEKNGSL